MIITCLVHTCPINLQKLGLIHFKIVHVKIFEKLFSVTTSCKILASALKNYWSEGSQNFIEYDQNLFNVSTTIQGYIFWLGYECSSDYNRTPPLAPLEKLNIFGGRARSQILNTSISMNTGFWSTNSCPRWSLVFRLDSYSKILRLEKSDLLHKTKIVNFEPHLRLSATKMDASNLLEQVRGASLPGSGAPAPGEELRQVGCSAWSRTVLLSYLDRRYDLPEATRIFSVRLYSEIDHIHLSSEAQCVSHHLPQVDCHRLYYTSSMYIQDFLHQCPMLIKIMALIRNWSALGSMLQFWSALGIDRGSHVYQCWLIPSEYSQGYYLIRCRPNHLCRCLEGTCLSDWKAPDQVTSQIFFKISHIYKGTTIFHKNVNFWPRHSLCTLKGTQTRKNPCQWWKSGK